MFDVRVSVQVQFGCFLLQIGYSSIAPISWRNLRASAAATDNISSMLSPDNSKTLSFSYFGQVLRRCSTVMCTLQLMQATVVAVRFFLKGTLPLSLMCGFSR